MSPSDESRQTVRLWERGVSESEIAFIFGKSRYAVRRDLKSAPGFEVSKQIHRTNNRRMTAQRRERVRERMRLHSNESRRAAYFYVRSHEILGRKARYDPSELERVERIVKREGSP